MNEALWTILEEDSLGIATLFEITGAYYPGGSISWEEAQVIRHITKDMEGNEYFDFTKLIACFLLAEMGEL